MVHSTLFRSPFQQEAGLTDQYVSRIGLHLKCLSMFPQTVSGTNQKLNICEEGNILQI